MSSLTLSSNLNMENVFPDPVHQQIFSHLSPRRGELPIHVVETIAGAFPPFCLPFFLSQLLSPCLIWILPKWEGGGSRCGTGKQANEQTKTRGNKEATKLIECGQ